MQDHETFSLRAPAGADRFTACPDCGELFDMRDLDLLLYHLQPRHAPQKGAARVAATDNRAETADTAT
ncbi:MAG TPA: hypothetical protein VN667_13620 [Burkholderiales bacterium]|nr:hypothetical protein [Burkholderiales bacterium]